MALDYRDFSRNGAPAPNAGDLQRPSARWWKAEGDDLAQVVEARLEWMRTRQNARITQSVINARLYSNQAINGRAGLSFTRVATSQPWLKERITWNCVQASADTVVSKMVKNKPKPQFLANGGSWKMQKRAKKLNKFVDGVFYENDAHKMGNQATLDSTIAGDGIILVKKGQNKRVKWVRMLASELWADDMDGLYGNPRSVHWLTDVDRDILLEDAKEWLKGEDSVKREAILGKIEKSSRTKPDGVLEVLVEKVAVAESWHLPSSPTAKDGKHCITIKDCTVLEEEWDHDVFPFAKLPWSPRPVGYWAQSLAEQLQNIQLEINLLLQTIKQSFWKGGTFRVFLPAGSRLVKENLTNQIASIVTYSGEKPPVIVTPQLVQPEIFQHLMSLWNKAFEQAGVSQMQATAEKPAGLNSGEALRTYNDIQTDRFVTIGQAYERFFLDLARLSIMVVKDIAGNGSYKVKTKVGNGLKEFDWKDVKLDEDDYVIQVFPISSLPSEPAGRQQTITEWVEAGWINARQGRRLMDFPDLEMAESLATAAEDFLTEVLERMTDPDEDYVYRPEPYDDINLARELALEYYQRGKYQGVEERYLEKLRTFMQELDMIQAQAQGALDMQQQMAQPGAGGPGPIGKPQPNPQSDLMPIPGAPPGAQGTQMPPPQDQPQA